MTDLIFLDTETTGLSLTDDIWEFAAIRRTPAGDETELHLFIEHDSAKCRNLPALFRDDHNRRFPGCGTETSKAHARGQIRMFLRPNSATGDKAHIVGAVPNFDTERLQIFLGETHAPWHYHLIDVENLAVGWLAANGHTVPLPWSSDDLSRDLMVEPPGDDLRHTAMGDARWAMAIYDAVMGSES